MNYRELEEQKALAKGYKYLVEDREAGNIIDWARTEEGAQSIINQFEREDKEMGTYKPNFYSIYDIVNECNLA